MKLTQTQINKARSYISWHFRTFDMLPTSKSVAVHCMLCNMSRKRGMALAQRVYSQLKRKGLVTNVGHLSGRRHISPGKLTDARSEFA